LTLGLYSAPIVNGNKEVNVMKKMRGFADPITLGFVLAALITAAGATTANRIAAQEKLAKAPVPTVSVALVDK
jgi:hypothetical protein